MKPEIKTLARALLRLADRLLDDEALADVRADLQRLADEWPAPIGADDLDRAVAEGMGVKP